jgi:hypothetical protein
MDASRSAIVQPVALALLLTAWPVLLTADALSDLQQRLEKFLAKAPFAASAKVHVNAAAQEDASRAGKRVRNRIGAGRIRHSHFAEDARRIRQ